MCVPIRGRTSHWLSLVRPALKLNLSHAAFHTSAARTKPLGVRLVKDDCGSVAATPLISGDIVDGPTFVSPSAAAAAATAVFAAPFITSIQPWEMTASCLSLLAAAAAHYPHLVRASNVYYCPIPSLIAAVIVIHNSAGVEASARGLAMCRFDGTGCGSVLCVHSLDFLLQTIAARVNFSFPSLLLASLSGSCGVLLAQSLCANLDIIGARLKLFADTPPFTLTLTLSCRSSWFGRRRLQRPPRNADRYVACGGACALQCRLVCCWHAFAGFCLVAIIVSNIPC